MAKTAERPITAGGRTLAVPAAPAGSAKQRKRRKAWYQTADKKYGEPYRGPKGSLTP